MLVPFVASDATSLAFTARAITEDQLDGAKESVHLERFPSAREELRRLCTVNLEHGGRGIGNAVEAQLTNPLTRALFDQAVKKGQMVVVSRCGKTAQLTSFIEIKVAAKRGPARWLDLMARFWRSSESPIRSDLSAGGVALLFGPRGASFIAPGVSRWAVGLGGRRRRFPWGHSWQPSPPSLRRRTASP